MLGSKQEACYGGTEQWRKGQVSHFPPREWPATCCRAECKYRTVLFEFLAGFSQVLEDRSLCPLAP